MKILKNILEIAFFTVFIMLISYLMTISFNRGLAKCEHLEEQELIECYF